jgi:hypothetical protein
MTTTRTILTDAPVAAFWNRDMPALEARRMCALDCAGMELLISARNAMMEMVLQETDAQTA